MFLPWISFGILGLFFPYCYAFLPVHESSICICSFYYDALVENFHYYLFLDREGTYAALTTINILSFYSLNFFFLLALTIMVWRIRKIDDDTMIKSECTTIVILWCFIAAIQYGFFIATQLDSCDSSWLTDHNLQ